MMLAYRLTSRLSHTMMVSTAPKSNPLSVSSTMKQYLPVSWLISSKYFCNSRFSYGHTWYIDAVSQSVIRGGENKDSRKKKWTDTYTRSKFRKKREENAVPSVPGEERIENSKDVLLSQTL